MQKHKEILEAAINREILELKEHVDHVLKTKARELVDDKNVEICENFFYEPEGEVEDTEVKKKSKLSEMDRQQGGILDRYLQKNRDPSEHGAKDTPKRKAGRGLALQKRWGDKKYGFTEPRVKAVERNNEETDKKSDWDNKIKQGMDYLAGKGKKPKSWKKHNPDSVNAKVKDTLDKMNKGKLDPKEYD